MGALLLTLLACNPYEGTWVIFGEVSKSPDDSQLGQDISTTLELHALSDGSYTGDFASILLAGSIENNELSLSTTEGYTYSGPGCDERRYSRTVSFTGDFDGAGGLSGKLKLVDAAETTACGGDDNDSQTYEYSITGAKLSANDASHAAGNPSWGY